jgi:hypothetical protein
MNAVIMHDGGPRSLLCQSPQFIKQKSREFSRYRRYDMIPIKEKDSLMEWNQYVVLVTITTYLKRCIPTWKTCKKNEYSGLSFTIR